MPELPEVELHRRNLSDWMIGRTVTALEVRDPLLAGAEEASRWSETLSDAGSSASTARPNTFWFAQRVT